MANYITETLNRFIDSKDEILDYLTGQYMDSLENHVLDLGDQREELGNMMFVRVLSYRRTGDEQSDLNHTKNAMTACLAYCHNIDAAFGYFIVSDKDIISLYLAVEENETAQIVEYLNAQLRDVSISKGFIPPENFYRLTRYSGVITGDVFFDEQTVDTVLSSILKKNSFIGIIAIPESNKKIHDYLDGLQTLKKTADRIFDRAKQSLFRYSQNHNIDRINEILERKIGYYSDTSEAFWKMCIWYGSETERDAPLIAQSVTGIMNAKNKNQDESARCFRTAQTVLSNGHFYLPLSHYLDVQYEYPVSLYKPSLISYISTSHLSSLLQLPLSSVNGFRVFEMEKNADSIHLFDSNYETANSSSLILGTDRESGLPSHINYNDLTEHVLVTGATGSGKTNTVFTFLKDLHDNRIPALIIEPSKNDYYKLAPEIRGLKIFSFGRNADALQINPCVPEEGTIIANHIDSLLYAFSGAFEMEEPTRLALDGLLKFAYESCGWKMSDIAARERRQYPTIKMLLELLPVFVSDHLEYGREVNANVSGSLVNRLSYLNTGILGGAMNTLDSISGRELTESNTLIELNDLSLDTKSLITMLVLIKADQYLRHTGASDTLRNVVVLEEAHNVFANTSMSGISDSRRNASDFLSNMLSQIRAYGTGIIIADQGASQINETAVSNTKVKIIHSTGKESDADAVKFAMNLSDAQKRMIPSLAKGEAIVSVRGTGITSRVQINHYQCRIINNYSCILCPKARICDRFNLMTSAVIQRKNMYALNILSMRYDPKQLRKTVNAISQSISWEWDDLCLLGILLEELTIGPLDKRNIISLYMCTEN